MSPSRSNERIASLKGLVMAGGFSKRMGEDKALINYHGIPQVLWTYQLLEKFCKEVYVSCRQDQHLGVANHLPRIQDRVVGRGPAEGVASALHEDPESAWLVVACDLPKLSDSAIQELVDERNPEALATVYRSCADQLPEPLCAIYEPSILDLLKDSIYSTQYSLRKILMKGGDQIHCLKSREDGSLENFNTPEEALKLN